MNKLVLWQVELATGDALIRAERIAIRCMQHGRFDRMSAVYCRVLRLREVLNMLEIKL